MKLFNKIFKSKEVHKMKVNIINNLPNINVSVNQNTDGSVAIIVEEQPKGKPLSAYKPGETVILGRREYIVLGHADETTALITKDIVKNMEFGTSGDYRKSYVRGYCNGDYYKELANVVGANNIIPHTVNLMCDDGSNKGVVCKDNVSILTMANYGRYREYLAALGKPFWTATGVTVLDKDYARDVCFVYSNGVPRWTVCGWSFGVRPFCILRSSVLVS
jgi:hypothetical protein